MALSAAVHSLCQQQQSSDSLLDVGKVLDFQDQHLAMLKSAGGYVYKPFTSTMEIGLLNVCLGAASSLPGTPGNKQLMLRCLEGLGDHTHLDGDKANQQAAEVACAAHSVEACLLGGWYQHADGEELGSLLSAFGKLRVQPQQLHDQIIQRQSFIASLTLLGCISILCGAAQCSRGGVILVMALLQQLQPLLAVACGSSQPSQAIAQAAARLLQAMVWLQLYAGCIKLRGHEKTLVQQVTRMGLCLVRKGWRNLYKTSLSQLVTVKGHLGAFPFKLGSVLGVGQGAGEQQDADFATHIGPDLLKLVMDKQTAEADPKKQSGSHFQKRMEGLVTNAVQPFYYGRSLKVPLSQSQPAVLQCEPSQEFDGGYIACVDLLLTVLFQLFILQCDGMVHSIAVQQAAAEPARTAAAAAGVMVGQLPAAGAAKETQPAPATPPATPPAAAATPKASTPAAASTPSASGAASSAATPPSATRAAPPAAAAALPAVPQTQVVLTSNNRTVARNLLQRRGEAQLLCVRDWELSKYPQHQHKVYIVKLLRPVMQLLLDAHEAQSAAELAAGTITQQQAKAAADHAVWVAAALADDSVQVP
jgi:hypothetical protein